MRIKKRRWYTYSQYLNSKHWHVLRNIKLKESGYRCQSCGNHGNKNNPLNVHHEKYGHSWGDESLKDLRVLCNTCHLIEHGNMEASNDPQYSLGF